MSQYTQALGDKLGASSSESVHIGLRRQAWSSSRESVHTGLKKQAWSSSHESVDTGLKRQVIAISRHTSRISQK